MFHPFPSFPPGGFLMPPRYIAMYFIKPKRLRASRAPSLAPDVLLPPLSFTAKSFQQSTVRGGMANFRYFRTFIDEDSSIKTAMLSRSPSCPAFGTNQNTEEEEQLGGVCRITVSEVRSRDASSCARNEGPPRRGISRPTIRRDKTHDWAHCSCNASRCTQQRQPWPSVFVQASMCSHGQGNLQHGQCLRILPSWRTRSHCFSKQGPATSIKEHGLLLMFRESFCFNYTDYTDSALVSCFCPCHVVQLPTSQDSPW